MTTQDQELVAYFRQISKIPLLTKKEEHELGIKATNGDETARKKLVEHNLRFVVSIANRFKCDAFTPMDLVGFGNEGLIKAAERYDYRKGVHFITYAVWWIEQVIKKEISTHGSIIRFPQNVGSRISVVKKTLADLSLEGMSDDEAILKITSGNGKDSGKLKELLQMSSPYVSLNAPAIAGEEGSQIIENLVSTYVLPEEELLDEGFRNILTVALDRLTDREREVLRFRFGLGDTRILSLKEIGLKYNLTKERIRQIEKKALRKLSGNPAVRRALDYYLQ